MVSERSLQVLRVIVNDYVTNREPVGSKTIAERHGFGVSAATIRNDMSQLEEAELIAAPHTSSGRIPTDRGYRVFVDRFAAVRPVSSAQKRAIESFLDGANDFDLLLERAVRSLAQLTNSVAIAQVPSLARASVHHIDFVRLGDRRVLTVLITDSGRVDQRMTDLEQPIPDDVLALVRERVAARLVGRTIERAASALRDAGEFLEPAHAAVAAPLVASLLAQVLANRQEKVIVAGAANLARTERDFPSSIHPVLEAIEEQVVLLRLFGELDAATSDDAPFTARIGREHLDEHLVETAVVSSEYRSEGGAARLGVIGPTRMDYQRNIVAVRAVARYLSRQLGDPAETG